VRHPARVGYLADADQHVEGVAAMHGLAGQHEVVGQEKLDLDLRMAGAERVQQRRQMLAAEPERAVHLQLARHHLAALLQGLLDGLHALDDPGGMLGQQVPLVRQLQAARGAHRQAHAQPRLELAETLGDRGRRDVFLACQGGQAAYTVQRQDEAQVVDVQLHY